MVDPRPAVELAPDTVAREDRADAVVLPAQDLMYRAADPAELLARAARGDRCVEGGVRHGDEFLPLFVLERIQRTRRVRR